MHKHKVRGFDCRKGGLNRLYKRQVHYSPSLIAHAPGLSHTALLPHFNHTCEGLHAWLPLGNQRHLPLCAHVGPGMKTGRRYLTCQNVTRCFYRCTDGDEAIYEHCYKCCSKDRWTELPQGFLYSCQQFNACEDITYTEAYAWHDVWVLVFLRVKGNSSYITY